MDVDEHIDLINTLGDILGQKDESKRDKFIDTMPTIIQMHLITEKTWAETTEKVKELEHIIRKCDPLAAALPTFARSFCSHLGGVFVCSFIGFFYFFCNCARGLYYSGYALMSCNFWGML